MAAQTPPKPVLTPAPESTPAPAVQPGPQATPGEGAAPAADSSSYVIGADDVLQIMVWHEPTLSGSLPVRPDGMISLALLGDIKAAGLTPTELSKDITSRLKTYVQNPIVTVVVSAVNSQRIFLVGEVGHVGPVQLLPGMSPLQAIAAAGGLSPFANSKHIYILRGPQGKQVKIPFNYKLALKGDNQQNIVLRPNDTIVVP
jgi:polysaccharide export outer membrane protein